MFDLVQRLRDERISAPPEHPVHPNLCDEAADEIERLQIECGTMYCRKCYNARLKEAEQLSGNSGELNEPEKRPMYMYYCFAPWEEKP